MAGYTAEWTVRGDMISFEVTAVTTGWVGIGFSLDRKMVSVYIPYNIVYLIAFPIDSL